MNTQKKSMVCWYDPYILVESAFRLVVSTVFGQFADKRETIATSKPIRDCPIDPKLDYSKEKEGSDLWFDFVADTGDGWDSTYAIARLLAERNIKLTEVNKPLPRGRIVFMGGDQVYPTASRKAYGDRLLGPYDTAYKAGSSDGKWPEEESPHLYALPGNHDWYDGLKAFFALFCRRRTKPDSGIGLERHGRVIGGRKTQQTRSYFAVKLRKDWWLWGTDSQLEGYIDQPQIEYFQHVAKNWMDAKSKVILCVGQPSWEYIDNKDPSPAFSSFSYLERLAGAAKDKDGQPLGHELKLILSGDSHHYARYFEGERQYITCGGGGAFLHPTHQLKDKLFKWKYPEPGIAHTENTPHHDRSFTIAQKAEENTEALYPDRNTSRKLTLWNLAFAFKNPLFVVTLFVLFCLYNWSLSNNANYLGFEKLADALDARNYCHAVCHYIKLSAGSLSTFLFISLVIAGCVGFSDAKSSLKRFLIGVIHGLSHFAAIALGTTFVVRNMPSWGSEDCDLIFSIILSSGLSAVISATVFGMYLLISLGIFNRHWNEAFSSFAHRGYKSFLRLKFDKDGNLIVYPIGLTKVPKDSGKRTKNPELAIHLIEKPVVIK